MTICCTCGRWWLGPRSAPCPGTVAKSCGHKPCASCGAGELSPDVERVIS